MKNNKNLFLDDKRMPSDAFIEKLWDIPHNIYIEEDWDIVESHWEFVKWIIDNGIPRMISFDHDLAPSHYTPKHLWNDYEKSKEWQDEQIHNEPTGLFSAIHIVEHCRKLNIELPICYVHSANPVGRDKILKALSL